MRLCPLVATAALALLFYPALTYAAEQVTIQSLLKEMVDREVIARLPSPAYTCAQASSYDRDSDSPEHQETWYANWDRSQFVRIDEKDGRKEYVLMDQEGPGAVVRFWATWHGPHGGPFSDGTLRIYIDGQEKPVVEGPASKVIDGGLLTEEPLSEGVSPETPYAQRGHNLYLPIPYAKSCKITYSTDVPVDVGAREGEALYYQINYRTYEKGTDVESFSMERLDAARQLVDATNKILSDGDREPEESWTSMDVAADIAPGKSTDPIRLEGAGAIRSLQCRIKADDVEQALRSTIVEISFDGQRTVWCPIGDFIGTGYKVRPHLTWYTKVDKSGLLSCAWVMPFEREAVIKLHNVGKQAVQVTDGVIRHSDWSWDDRSMHFHATWRQLTDVDTGAKKEMNGHNAFDVNYATYRGQGVYVGDTLTLCNGAAAWWGEGDEKVFVDGESFPSHFGTGTEDYYGYAWCRPEYFTSAFHAQPDGSGNLVGGYAVNSRYRSLDAIPFAKSIQFDMELWHWADTKINYAPTTYCYVRPGGKSNIEPDPKSAALPVGKERTDVVPPYRAEGAIEGESLKAVERTGGRTEIQGGFDFSDDRQLWWMDGKVGDKLVLEFPVERAGRYKVTANLTKAADYGVVAISVNDEPAKKFDRFHNGVAHNPEELGTFELKQGANRLTVEIVGANEKSEPKRHMFGLDYLKLE